MNPSILAQAIYAEPPTLTEATEWSPETETRPEVIALLARRSALVFDELPVLRMVMENIYDRWFDTLRCVARGRGVPAEDAGDVVHQSILELWDVTVASGFPDKLQARLVSLADGLARNHMRGEHRNQELPTSSKEAPGSFPKPDRDLDVRELAHALWNTLTDDHKAIVDAVILRDLTVAAAARELGLAWSTADDRLTAALTFLREKADEMCTPSALPDGLAPQQQESA